MADNTTVTAEGQAILSNFKARIKPWVETMETYIGKVVYPAFGIAGRTIENAKIAEYNAIIDAKVLSKETKKALIKGWAGMHFCGDVIDSLAHNAIVDLRNLGNKAALKLSNAGTKVTEKAKRTFYKTFEGAAVGIAEHLHNAKERIRSVGQLFSRIKGLEGLVAKEDVAVSNRVADQTYQLIAQKAEHEQKAGYPGIYTNLLARYNELNGEGKLDLKNPEVKAFLGSCYACCFFGKDVFSESQRKAVETSMLEKLQTQTSVRVRAHYDKKFDTIKQTSEDKIANAKENYETNRRTIIEESAQSSLEAGKEYNASTGKITLKGMLEAAKKAFGNVVDMLSNNNVEDKKSLQEEINELKETREKYVNLFNERVQEDAEATVEEGREATASSATGAAAV